MWPGDHASHHQDHPPRPLFSMTTTCKQSVNISKKPPDDPEIHGQWHCYHPMLFVTVPGVGDHCWCNTGAGAKTQALVAAASSWAYNWLWPDLSLAIKLRRAASQGCYGRGRQLGRKYTVSLAPGKILFLEKYCSCLLFCVQESHRDEERDCTTLDKLETKWRTDKHFHCCRS